MEVSGKLHAPIALRPKKEASVPTGQEAAWAPHAVWKRWWREKKSLPLPGIEILSSIL